MNLLNTHKISVVHLVRKKNGIEPFRNFIESYHNYPAGIQHTLLIIYKGFYQKQDIGPYEEMLRDIPHEYFRVMDFGFDLRAYFVAIKHHDSQYFCFLNSFSVLLHENWLLKLYKNITLPNVGLVGATGSWGSICPRLWKNKPDMALWKKLVKPLYWEFLKYCFDYFPNYHIRTNGFMVERAVMSKIRYSMIFTKMQAYKLESGKSSITRQVEKMGLRAVIVDKDGIAYNKTEWNTSDILWQGTQDNLLISDNQTRKYAAADPAQRRQWEMFAWEGK